MTAVPWKDLSPNAKNAWLTEGLKADYDDLPPIGSKGTKTQKALEVKAIFKNYGRGVSTCRDEWAYDFDRSKLEAKMTGFISRYNSEIDRWKQRADKETPLDAFVNDDSTKYKWSEGLKNNLARGLRADLSEKAFQPALFRPFCKQWLYFDRALVERVYQMPTMFPNAAASEDNRVLVVSDQGHRAPFSIMAVSAIPDLHMLAAIDGFQCFPLYTYALDGKIRRDNITDWSLGQFQARYGPGVTKRDIFHYVYGLLHSPQYRERYKENLKRELPRLPLVESPADYHVFVAAGAELAALHVGYEQAAEYPLKQVVNKDVPRSWRVTKMRLKGASVEVNESLTLLGVPPEAFDYKLGNRSALAWVLDQYQVSTDKRSGIVSDPNRADDREYIVRLVRRVVTVSVETVRIVAGLPAFSDPLGEAGLGEAGPEGAVP